jgi:hypothetical protein
MFPSFSVGEWLVCPKCGVTCDAPFHPVGVKEKEPELVLGNFLPNPSRMLGEQKIELTASCPRCAHELRAIATFYDGCLREFASLEEPIQPPQTTTGSSAPDRV